MFIWFGSSGNWKCHPLETPQGRIAQIEEVLAWDPETERLFKKIVNNGDAMFKDNNEGQTHSYDDGCGEPAHNGPAGTYEGAPMKGDPVDTRTEITWDNLKAGDTLVRDFFRRKVLVVFGEIFAWAESGTDEDVDWAFKGEARRSGWKLDGSNDKPIKMTISQIEEKIGHKVEIVE